MHNELTKKDIQMMKDELDYRRIQLRPQLLEAVKEARAFGDLSENFEYKAAKQEKNRISHNFQSNKPLISIHLIYFLRLTQIHSILSHNHDLLYLLVSLFS